ncbi:MAG: efflux RND transporter permease subunit, partial [Candidatus Competibacteraceae bacterium]|nr:efflux RND transporter permease subunit [Candidatus Competibacteraceae bacterium]
YDFTLRPEGRSLGLTAAEVARQVRGAFSGVEALSQQRGRNEVTVRVRLPRSQRAGEYDLEQLLIRTPAGGHVPLGQVARVEQGRAYTSITRRDGRRTVSVSADVEPAEGINQVVAALSEQTLPQLIRDYPGLSAEFRGRQEATQDSMSSLTTSSIATLLAIYALLAIPFRSYTQPLLIMVAIPFGVVGAILGHWLMGFGLSIISIQGIVALAGVVVNDNLVLIDYANRQRRAGLSAHGAVVAAGIRRFRPILLTTLTTFGGLAPMIFETSRQARFMIPMAISLGYGILFATVISLLLVPCHYLILDDLLGANAEDRSEEMEGAVEVRTRQPPLNLPLIRGGDSGSHAPRGNPCSGRSAFGRPQDFSCFAGSIIRGGSLWALPSR